MDTVRLVRALTSKENAFGKCSPKTKDNPLVICTVMRIFWSERKVEKARVWFGRALAQDSDLGDAWAWWLKFEKQHGTEETPKEVINLCIAAEPHHSPIWQSVVKDDKHIGRNTKDGCGYHPVGFCIVAPAH